MFIRHYGFRNRIKFPAAEHSLYPSVDVSKSPSIEFHLGLLIDPVELAGFVLDHLTLLEPQSDLLFRILDAVGAVANVAANILWDISVIESKGHWLTRRAYNRIVTTDGSWG